MEKDLKNISNQLAGFLSAEVDLENLHQITHDISTELEISRKLFKEIKTSYDSISHFDNLHEDSVSLEEFPLLYNVGDDLNNLLPDMVAHDDLNIEQSISDIRKCIEKLKSQTYTIPNNHLAKHWVTTNSLDFNLDQCADSLKHLSDQLNNIKLNKNKGNNRNKKLEEKLSQLCKDVEMFNQLVQSKATLSQQCENWNDPAPAADDTITSCGVIINNITSKVNTVTYLLQRSKLKDSY